MSSDELFEDVSKSYHLMRDSRQALYERYLRTEEQKAGVNGNRRDTKR